VVDGVPSSSTRSFTSAGSDDGTLTLLGVAATGVERDANGIPVTWAPYHWRFVGRLIDRDLTLDGYFPSDYLAQRWELRR
jgi:hypothetical protein